MQASINSTGMKTAKAIERYFTVALYLLVLTGFGALASTGGLDLPAVTLVGLALILRGYQLVTRREPIISERWTNILTLVYVFIYLVDYSFVSRGFLGATVHLALFVMVVRLFSLRGTRDHYMLAALSFGMVLAASVLTVGSVFLFSFAIFLLVAIITFVLMEMRHSLSEDLALSHDPGSHDPRSDDSRSVASGTGIARVDSNRRMAHALLAIAPALMLMVLAGRRYIPPGVHPHGYRPEIIILGAISGGFFGRPKVAILRSTTARCARLFDGDSDDTGCPVGNRRSHGSERR